MNISATVAPQGGTSQGTGTTGSLRLGNMLDLIVTELHGRYYEGNYRRTRYGGATQAAVATTAAFATTYTGLVLYNPAGSAVNGVLEKVGIVPILAQTTSLAFGLMVGASLTQLSGLTAVTPRSKNIGSGAAPVLGLASAATLPIAPTLDTLLGYIGTGAVTVDQSVQGLFDMEGSILIPANGFVAIYTSAASVAASLLLSIQWEEVPI